MKISPAKVLLGISLATYGYCLRGQFMSDSRPLEEAPGSSKELTASFVNRVVALNCARDPFTGEGIKGMPNQPLLIQGTAQNAGPTNLVLQGVAVGDGVRSAIINGKASEEGGTEKIDQAGPDVHLKTVGPDYAVI